MSTTTTRRRFRAAAALASATAAALLGLAAPGHAATTSSAPVVGSNPQLAIVPDITTTARTVQATFTASGSGTPAPTITWQHATFRNGPWATVSSATTETLTFNVTNANRGQLYRAVFHNSAGVAYSRAARLVTRTHWMQDLHDDANTIPLTELAIPGSHDTGTWKLTNTQSRDHQADACDKVPDSICNSYAKAQSRSASQELNDGIRYFDLRVCGSNQAESTPQTTEYAAYSVHPVTCHGLVAAPLSLVLQQTHDWVVGHPHELVVLDFNHHYQVDPDMEVDQIWNALRYADGTSMLISPSPCDAPVVTCGGGLTLQNVGEPDASGTYQGSVIVNFENDGSGGYCVWNPGTDCGRPVLDSAFYARYNFLWGTSDTAPYGGKYCTTGGSFTSCFGNTDVPGDALNSDRNTTDTRQTFAEPHPATDFQHFFVQFLQTTPDGKYMAAHPDSSLHDMAVESNPQIGPGFLGCGDWGVSDCFAQRRPENINVLALNFYDITDYVVSNGGASFTSVHFDFIQEVIKLDEYAHTAPVVTITPATSPAGTGWYNASRLGGQGKKLTVYVTADDYKYPTGIDQIGCEDNGTPIPVVGTAPTPSMEAVDTVTLGEGVHALTCWANDGAHDGTLAHGNHGAGPDSTGRVGNGPSSDATKTFKVDTVPPTVCPKNLGFVLNDPTTSVPVSASDLTSGTDSSTLAMPVNASSVGSFTQPMRVKDNAGNATNAQCVYTVGYAVVQAYDPSVGVAPGGTKAIVVGLRDYNNATQSGLSVRAVWVRNTATNATTVPVAAGSNSKMTTFTTVKAGYEFDVSTNGFAPGTYMLGFVAGNDPVAHEVPFTVVSPPTNGT